MNGVAVVVEEVVEVVVRGVGVVVVVEEDFWSLR